MQQITNPDDTRRFQKVALQRVKGGAGEGRRRIRDSDNSYSKAGFTSAATLVTFDSHTQGQHSKEVQEVRKELVVALGNAAEMAIRDQLWQQALYFGSGAAGVAEDIPASEQLDSSVRGKNKRRIERARAAISGK